MYNSKTFKEKQDFGEFGGSADLLGVRPTNERSSYLTNSDKMTSAPWLRFSNAPKIEKKDVDFEAESWNLFQETRHLLHHDKQALRNISAIGYYRFKYINYNTLVVYRNFNPLGRSKSGYDNAAENSNTDQARYASKALAQDILLANVDIWRYFATFTFDSTKQDRNDFVALRTRITRFLRRRSIKFFIIPEFHEKGGIHFHALLSEDIKPYLAEFEGKALKNPYIHSKIVAHEEIYNCPAIQQNYGYTIIEPIKNVEACVLYITKYVLKTFDDENFPRISRHRFFHSRGLRSPSIVNPLHPKLKLEEFDVVALSKHTQKIYLKRADYRTRQVSLGSYATESVAYNPAPFPINRIDEGCIP